MAKESARSEDVKGKDRGIVQLGMMVNRAMARLASDVLGISYMMLNHPT